MVDPTYIRQVCTKARKQKVFIQSDWLPVLYKLRDMYEENFDRLDALFRPELINVRENQEHMYRKSFDNYTVYHNFYLSFRKKLAQKDGFKECWKNEKMIHKAIYLIRRKLNMI